MDYKYIEQLMERYWNAETSQEEESILRTFFSQKQLPAEMEHLRALFYDEASGQTLDDDFDMRLTAMIEEGQGADTQQNAPATVKARQIRLSQRLAPFFKAAAVVAIILTVGGALQAPWDKSWNTPEDYAAMQHDADTVVAIRPIQADNFSEAIPADSTAVLMPEQAKD